MTPFEQQKLLEDIDALTKKFADAAFPDYMNRFADWKETVVRAMLADQLKEHPGIKECVKGLDENVQQMEFVLLNQPNLEKAERDLILARRDAFRFFRGMVWPYTEELENIRKEVTENLES